MKLETTTFCSGVGAVSLSPPPPPLWTPLAICILTCGKGKVDGVDTHSNCHLGEDRYDHVGCGGVARNVRHRHREQADERVQLKVSRALMLECEDKAWYVYKMVRTCCARMEETRPLNEKYPICYFLRFS